MLDDSLGKIKYYAIRVEFQVTGNTLIHSFLWILDASTLSKDNIDEYIIYVHSIIGA